MKILHIGKGFIGLKVIDRLRASGHTVDIVDLPEFDLTNRQQVLDTIKGYDAVLLMAAISNLNFFEADPIHGMDVNMGGLTNVVQACSDTHTLLYYISTCCVYGNTRDLPSSEEARPEPSEIYAACKLAGEWIIKGYRKSFDLDYVILRIATTYGPGMRAALAPAVFINQINKGEPITVHGDGEQTRTLTYIDDEADGIVAVINSGVKNETFNISTEEEKSVNELIDIIKTEMNTPDHPVMYIKNRKGQTFKEQIDAKKVREIRIWKGRYAPTAKKVTQITGWSAKYSLREGIRETLTWMKKNNIKEIK
jgi:UDP-glucose 4-epimerase